MNMTHSIRLRGPWERDALGPDGGGPFRYSRRFHKPTGLEASSRVWLVVEDAEGEAVVVLNGQEVARFHANAYPARLDITTAISENNRLEITIQPEEGRSGELGLVRLEIEELAR